LPNYLPLFEEEPPDLLDDLLSFDLLSLAELPFFDEPLSFVLSFFVVAMSLII
jgi:hypothetical protein